MNILGEVVVDVKGGGGCYIRPQRCDITAGHIHILSGLSTAAMKIALAGSVALLSPSLAEGFGLPVIEAAHLGVPVVASDIAAHREVAREGAILCDATDAPSWIKEIRTLMETKPRRAAMGASRARAEREAYFAAISTFLDQIRMG
jgi:glycosyltransferase involved in cell wall biosynthesis